MGAWADVRVVVRAKLREARRTGIRAIVKKVLAGAASVLLKLSVALVVGAVALALVPLLPPKLQSSTVTLLRKAGVPETLTPADPYGVKYKVNLDPKYGTGLVNDLFKFGSESKVSPVLYASGIPNVVVCRAWEHSGASLNEVLLAFLKAHPTCFSLTERVPNGYFVTINPTSTLTVFRPDRSVRAMACECPSAEDVEKTLNEASLP